MRLLQKTLSLFRRPTLSPGLPRAERGQRPAAQRCVLLEDGGVSPSGDYLLLPWLERLGLEILRVDLRQRPPADLLKAGDLVVLSRYAPKAWQAVLARQAPRLAGLVYFMDDDLLDPAALQALPADYARRLQSLATSQRAWLEHHTDALWVSTPALQHKYAALNPTVIPLAPGPALRGPRPVVRLAYHGTASHGEDLAWLREVVASLQQACDLTHVELSGNHAVHKAWRDLPRVTVLHPMSWPNYLAWTATHPADIGLAPLLPGPFNAARGAVKFHDYARMGATGLYADVAPYRGYVRDGVDGLLLPMEPQAWVRAILALVADTPRRQALQAAAVQRHLDGGD